MTKETFTAAEGKVLDSIFSCNKSALSLRKYTRTVSGNHRMCWEVACNDGGCQIQLSLFLSDHKPRLCCNVMGTSFRKRPLWCDNEAHEAFHLGLWGMGEQLKYMVNVQLVIAFFEKMSTSEIPVAGNSGFYCGTTFLIILHITWKNCLDEEKRLERVYYAALTSHLFNAAVKASYYTTTSESQRNLITTRAKTLTRHNNFLRLKITVSVIILLNSWYRRSLERFYLPGTGGGYLETERSFYQCVHSLKLLP